MFAPSDLLWCLLALAIYGPFAVVSYIDDARDTGRYFALKRIQDMERQMLFSAFIATVSIALLSYKRRELGVHDDVEAWLVDKFMALACVLLAFSVLKLYGSVVVGLYIAYIEEPDENEVRCSMLLKRLTLRYLLLHTMPSLIPSVVCLHVSLLFHALIGYIAHMHLL